MLPRLTFFAACVKSPLKLDWEAAQAKNGICAWNKELNGNPTSAKFFDCNQVHQSSPGKKLQWRWKRRGRGHDNKMFRGELFCVYSAETLDIGDFRVIKDRGSLVKNKEKTQGYKQERLL